MSVDAVTAALLDGIEAQIAVVKVQVAALRQRLETLRTTEARREPEAREKLPPRCASFPAKACALRDEDAQIDRDAFGVSAWECRGCGHREELGAGEASA